MEQFRVQSDRNEQGLRVEKLTGIRRMEITGHGGCAALQRRRGITVAPRSILARRSYDEHLPVLTILIYSSQGSRLCCRHGIIGGSFSLSVCVSLR